MGSVLDKGSLRFAVSGLSKDRYSEAKNEEMLVDKITGEYLLKNREGFVVSSDTTNRMKSAINKAIIDAEQSGICGDLYQIELTNYIFPCVIPYQTNILDESFQLPAEINRFLFNFDVSEQYCQANQLDTRTEVESSVMIDVRRGNEEFSITKKISDMNKLIINSMDYCTDDEYPIEITSIMFIPESYYIGDSSYRLLLHNMFITYNV